MRLLSAFIVLVSMIFQGSLAQNERDLCKTLRSWNGDSNTRELYTILGCASFLSSCGRINSRSCPAHPWVVSIRSKSTRKHICVGTLISEEHVVTAASCFDRTISPWDIEIGLGSSKISFLKYRNVRKIQTHQWFKSIGTENDIAILTFESRAKMDPCVQPICLPSFAQYPTSTDAIVASWGSKSTRSRSVQETRMTLFGMKRCRNQFPEVLDWDSRLCSGVFNHGNEICEDHTGAPLMVEYSGQWFLHGIGSKIRHCEQQGIFMTVPYYTRWITKMKSYKF